jgi:hypothetical protein
MEPYNGGLEAQNGDKWSQTPIALKRNWIRIRINVKRWIRIRICIKMKNWIRICFKVMRIRNHGSKGHPAYRSLNVQMFP